MENITLALMLRIVRAVDYIARHIIITFGLIIILTEALLIAFIITLSLTPGLVPNLIGGLIITVTLTGITVALYTLYKVNRKDA